MRMVISLMVYLVIGGKSMLTLLFSLHTSQPDFKGMGTCKTVGEVIINLEVPHTSHISTKKKF